VRGEKFAAAGSGGAYQAMIDQRLARQAFPHEDPIGKRIRFGIGVSATIVGVVGSIKESGLSNEAPPMLYLPVELYPIPTLAVVARVHGAPLAIAPAVRGAVRGLDRDLPVYDVLALGDVISSSVAAPRTRMLVLGLFAVLALLLAAVGIYGVVAYAVTRRTREIGVRMALGASPGQVVGSVMEQGLRPVGLGIAAGLAGAFALGRLIQSQLFGVSPTDPATYAAIVLVLAAVAALACMIPARRAARVDPARALRAE
jgi:predicted permease